MQITYESIDYEYNCALSGLELMRSRLDPLPRKFYQEVQPTREAPYCLRVSHQLTELNLPTTSRSKVNLTTDRFWHLSVLPEFAQIIQPRLTHPQNTSLAYIPIQMSTKPPLHSLYRGISCMHQHSSTHLHEAPISPLRRTGRISVVTVAISLKLSGMGSPASVGEPVHCVRVGVSRSSGLRSH
jgi:hypothetical protein